MGQRIAIVGSGISGLGAAWALHGDNDITLFEGSGRVGGHANTVDVVDASGRAVAVDTGFIVYNEVTYPNLTRLLASLQVPTETSDMSFAFSLDRKIEYGASLSGVFGSKGNLRRGRFWRMLGDINRFRRTAAALNPYPGQTIDELLTEAGYSQAFRDDYLYPMTGAIWSARQAGIRQFPASSILEFMRNHGLIEIVGRPEWRTVTGGARRYVQRLTAGFSDRIRLATPVETIDRLPHSVMVTAGGRTSEFDQVVFATHTDQALAVLGDGATHAEIEALKSIEYQPNRAVLHSDPALMPRNPRIWASWNTMSTTQDREYGVASITYWMNRLQGLDPSFPLFVSLNPQKGPDPSQIHATFEYSHPQFDGSARNAQLAVAAMQGANRTWYTGAWMGYGFHEDGLQSGLNVAAALGSPAPWRGHFAPMSSAPEAGSPLVNA